MGKGRSGLDLNVCSLDQLQQFPPGDLPLFSQSHFQLLGETKLSTLGLCVKGRLRAIRAPGIRV